MSRFRFMLRMFAMKKDRLRVAQALALPVISEAAPESLESRTRGTSRNSEAYRVCFQEAHQASGWPVTPSPKTPHR